MRNIIIKNFITDDKYFSFRAAILVILLGFAIRLFSFQYTYIVNPDGVLYIHQARAIYYGLWDSILSCSLGFLSNYSILIVGFYKIFGDWVVAAKSVSFIFGSVTLILLYLLLGRFFNDNITLLITLVFALMPDFVDRCADVVRGPVYWFWLVLGLYLFITQIEKRNYLYLLLSSLCFLMASWARIEAILFILVSFIYLVCVKQDKKIQKITIFVIPVVFISLFSITALTIFNKNIPDLYRTHEITTKFFAPLNEYKTLNVSLAELMNQNLEGTLPHFLQKARNLIWLIALGTLMKGFVGAYFYPFLLIFIIGLHRIWTKIKEDRRVLYLTLSAGLSLILLYLHVMHTWNMFNRFFILFIIPSSVVLGFGMEKIINFLQTRFTLKPPVALFVVSLLILCFALPKNLKPREMDKLVFKEIGELIGRREGNHSEIEVATSLHSLRWTSFYANLNYRGAPCPQKYNDFEAIVGSSYKEFIGNLKKRGVQYFLWEERHWPIKRFDFIKSQDPKDFVTIGRWSHPDTGRLILFEVI
jgi:4-amino-4-deoxy-L-arabinose transferase-like glycosyltransferase